MKSDSLDRGFDLRRFLMLSVRKFWILIVGALIGAVLFGGYRFLKEKVFAPAQIYRCDIEFLITFTKGEEEAGYKPVWMPLDEAIAMFGDYERFHQTAIEDYGLYRREFYALKEYAEKY